MYHDMPCVKREEAKNLLGSMIFWATHVCHFHKVCLNNTFKFLIQNILNFKHLCINCWNRSPLNDFGLKLVHLDIE